SWHSNDGVDDTSSTGIKARLFAADGTPDAPEFLVNSETNSYQDYPTVTALSDGGFVVSWHSNDGVDDTSSTGIKARLFAADGTPDGPEFLVNSETYSGQYSPTITALSDGGFVVSWYSNDGVDDTSSSGIKAQIYEVVPGNTAPTITSLDTVSIDENTTDVMDVEATDDTDTEGSGLTYALTGGADAALFDIDTATGELSFLSAPDFETPGDDDGDNTYDVQVTVTDSGGLTDVQDIAVTVADVAENGAPAITSPDMVSVDENTTAVLDVAATDDTDTEGSGLTYALTGGADAALFDIDTATGELSFLSAPDFETPGDDDGDNTYDVQVTVTDSGGLTDVQDIAVTVADVAENTAPAFGFVQGFETDTDGVLDGGGYGAVSRVSSGTGGVASAEGGWHAGIVQAGDPGFESGPFTRFDGYRNEWPGEWTASVQVWLDTGWAAGEGFDYSVAANGTNGQHYRDYIFHVTQDTSTGDLLVGISNNSNFDPNESLESGDHGVIASSGWYTLEHRFYDDGGVLAVEMRVLDAEGAEVFSGTRSNPADTVGAGGVVGGNRYGWFTNIDIADGIEVDGFDLRLGEDAQDTGAITELAGDDPDAETVTHVAEGDLGFTDFDAGDTHTVSAAAQGAGYLGSFTATVSEATSTDGVGTVTWNLEVADADLADLAEGETLVQDYVLTVEDSQGLTTTRTVSVTITGTNDGPTITSSATVSVDENVTDVMDVDATDDTDTEGSGLTYALTG
ncbi:cadherin domain-containing protein, partial [Amaricoccus tamworthensis]|uniref:cadherin domain-containing protein n=1 Tax=Amaricoccus tamworthensis TaxID=57002 RepID=UPI003C7D7EE9